MFTFDWSGLITLPVRRRVLWLICLVNECSVGRVLGRGLVRFECRL